MENSSGEDNDGGQGLRCPFYVNNHRTHSLQVTYPRCSFETIARLRYAGEHVRYHVSLM